MYAEPTSPAGWCVANEAVRDLHRSLLEEPGRARSPLASQSADDLALAPQFRISPSVGTASELSQPGGFRRAHVIAHNPGAVSYTHLTLPTILLV